MVQIPNHSHCVICARAIAFGEKTCGEACQKEYDELQRKRKRSVTTLYVLIGVTVVIFALNILGRV